MTYIDADALRRFLDVVRVIQVDAPYLTDQYREGAQEAIGMVGIYLDTITPESDREVAA